MDYEYSGFYIISIGNRKIYVTPIFTRLVSVLDFFESPAGCYVDQLGNPRRNISSINCFSSVL